MKASQVLEGLGRTVAYYPDLALAFGNVKQALFICQLLYWSDKGKDPSGWIYKSQEEWRLETGLSFDEQRTARTALKRMKILEERHAKLEHRLYFRVNLDMLKHVWNVHLYWQLPFPEVEKTGFGKRLNATSLEQQLRIRNQDFPKLDLLKETKSTQKMSAADVSSGFISRSNPFAAPDETEPYESKNASHSEDIAYDLGEHQGEEEQIDDLFEVNEFESDKTLEGEIFEPELE